MCSVGWPSAAAAGEVKRRIKDRFITRQAVLPCFALQNVTHTCVPRTMEELDKRDKTMQRVRLSPLKKHI